MANRKRAVKLPTYAHETSTHAGIDERLALVARVHQRTYPTTPQRRSMVQPRGAWQHEIRLMCKSEGWEVSYVWVDDSKRITKESLHRHGLALAIEAARADWHETERIIARRLNTVGAGKAA